MIMKFHSLPNSCQTWKYWRDIYKFLLNILLNRPESSGIYASNKRIIPVRFLLKTYPIASVAIFGFELHLLLRSQINILSVCRGVKPCDLIFSTIPYM